MLPVHHLHLLLTKELIVIRRSKVWSVVEIAIPLIISVPLIALVLQNSSSIKHEAQFWESFQVTGDWRDIDRRLGNMQSIYSYCGILSRRNLGLVFPNNMDEKEISWTAREIEFRYLMNNSALHSHFFELNVKIFPTEAAMMEELLEDYHRSFMCTKYIAGIIFDEYNSSTLRLSYTIRIRQTEDPQTQWYVGDDIWESGGPYEILDDHFLINMVPNYWSLGILSLQYAIDTVFLKGTDDKKSNDSKFQLSLERIPEPPYFEKSVVKFLSFLIIFWQLFTLPCILHTVANIVSEKHSGIKTISSWLFFSTNFIYGAGAASFALLMSCIFHTPGAATKGTIVIWLVTIVLTRLQVTDGSVLLNIILSLNLNYAFICAHRAMQDYMNRAIYLDNVYPSGDLPRKQWFFFLHQSNNKHQQCTFDDSSDAQSDNIQKYEGNDQADIDIRHLTKTYAVQPAVDSMSFRAYRGEITVLLGHNGAGKSTTFSLITGLISPTSGSIYICGSRMESHSIDHCQREIGFCPQYNALFNLLTVREHLEMFRKLSGNTVDCVMELMTDMQLDNVADISEISAMLKLIERNCIPKLLPNIVEIAENLSGGMKRKLCVGISLVGGRRIILLDEPTAGMDPASRQAVVELLQRCKRERTILLTTHCMDEADLLGDRIAIMVRGRLFCAGTSEFLKNRFGTGYLLSIDLVPRQSSHHSLIQKEQLLSIIRKHVPETKKQSITPQQMTVLLPTESKKSFPNLFIDLEQNAEKYGINSFGLSLNTLEQVFLKVGELEDADSTVPIDIENMAEQQASILCSNSSVRSQNNVALALAASGIAAALLPAKEIAIPNAIGGVCIQCSGQSLELCGLDLKTDCFSHGQLYVACSRVGKPDNLHIYTDNETTKNIVDLQVIALLRKRFICYRKQWPRFIWQIVFPVIVLLVVVFYMKNLSTRDEKRHEILLNAGRINPSVVLLQLENPETLFGRNVLQIVRNITGNSYKLVPPSESMELSLAKLPKVPPPVSIAVMYNTKNSYIAATAFFNAKARYGPQLRTRLNTFIYWLSVIISDLILYAFVCAIFIVILNEWLSNLKFDLLLLWLMYLWPTLPLVYCVAFLINHPARAYIFLIIITLIVALCASIVSYIMMFIKPKLFPYLHTAFLFTLPTYSMSYGLIMILVADVNKDTSGLYSWEYESNLEDIDVKKERECISQKRNAELSLAVRNLNKYYGNLHAVRDLTFGIEPGECFGLLGVNGAGKTTTFDMLTGVSIPDGGEAFINGRSILKKQLIGFCPQFDALHPKLTARQTLQLLASLYGFANPMKRVETLLEAVSLTAHADICVEFLSGGQRRRLSLAVALISQTDLILLDEPTAGIDPKARRQIWCLLNAVREKRRAMLLTSHSMTECEALCNRIGIMDQGSLIAIGTPQHIKTRFGEKYTLIITISDQCRREDLICLVKKIFPDSIEKDTYRTCLLWDITKGESDRWSQMYGKLCQLAAQFPWITDYSLTQTTLEGAFLQLSQREK
ncbi:unnamed protein product [Onchocerca ochengi]|uniref:ABC transporter domain-containing protein n=1 Tax=Onchocerca ochengi TaxID=42157 RepID=A0A182DXG7_ONCOC|nr:unnamed protein product [Onchocerca ochengi]